MNKPISLNEIEASARSIIPIATAKFSAVKLAPPPPTGHKARSPESWFSYVLDCNNADDAYTEVRRVTSQVDKAFNKLFKQVEAREQYSNYLFQLAQYIKGNRDFMPSEINDSDALIATQNRRYFQQNPHELKSFSDQLDSALVQANSLNTNMAEKALKIFRLTAKHVAYKSASELMTKSIDSEPEDHGKTRAQIKAKAFSALAEKQRSKASRLKRLTK